MFSFSFNVQTYKTKDVTAGLDKLKKKKVDAFIYDSTGKFLKKNFLMC